jgi:secreted pullulanase
MLAICLILTFLVIGSVSMEVGAFSSEPVPESTDEGIETEVEPVPDGHTRIYYQRPNNDYKNWTLWVWNDTSWASEKGWPHGMEQTGRNQFGVYWDVPLVEGASNLGFLMVNKETEAKDGDDKGFRMLDSYNELYTFSGDESVYVSEEKDLPTGILGADIVSKEKIITNFAIAFRIKKDDFKLTDKEGTEVEIKEIEKLNMNEVEIMADIDPTKAPYKVTYKDREVNAQAGWRMIDEMYAYDGDDLGVTYNDGSATLKLWAPKASDVEAYLYDKDDQSKEVASVELSFDKDTGVWATDIQPSDVGVDDLKGYYYQYAVTNDGTTKRALDPYAESMATFTVNTGGAGGHEYTVDGETKVDNVGKAAIVDTSAVGPELDHPEIEGFEKREDAIIWEAHIRDFTSDPSIEGELDSRWGSYEAFADKLEYIKSLGVTHVQILPVNAWYYGDETKMGERESEYSAGGNSYNWGYDPHNYFSPDGAYSENPGDPEERIAELKTLIDAIHEAGMGVVLDVVYTHMAQAKFLNDIVPNYYFFMDENGNFVGGFGNNLATSHEMSRKLMVDSVKHWFEEYKIDGMRWDMMGDATADAVQEAYNEAEKINSDALFIGEGWRTFGGHVENPNLVPADQDWMDETDDVGVFSDELRNELKSGFGSEGEPRFITGGARSIQTIFNNVIAKPSNVQQDDPGDIVPYIAAHDNLPLHDVIAQSIKKDPADHEEEIQKRIRLGNTIVLTSQGTAFIHAGQEYGRTKQWKAEGKPEQKYHKMKDQSGEFFEVPYFVHDSYDSSDAVNMFDWDKVTEEGIHKETMEFTKGLIALRKSSDAFRLGETSLVESNVSLIESEDIDTTDLVIGYRAEATTGEAYYVFINADNKEREISLSTDLTDGTIIVDSDEAGFEEVTDLSGVELTADKITIAPLTPVIIKAE